MNRLNKLVLTVAVVALVASPVGAQQPRRGGGGGRGAGAGMGAGGMSLLALAAQKSVQEELKVTPDQVTKITEAQQKQQGAGRQGLADLSPEERTKKLQEMAKESEKTVAGILKPDQMKRLKQVQLQQEGARAFNNPEVAKALNITPEQKAKLKDIQDTMAKERAALRGNTGGDPTQARQKMQELTKKSNTEAMALLTADQQTKWKEMTGEPFKGEITFGGGRRQRQDR